MTRRHKFLIALLITTLVIATIVFFWQQRRSEQVRISMHSWPGYEMLHLSDNIKVLDHNLVHLVDSKSATDSLQKLVDGEVDAAALTLDEMVRANAAGQDLVTILVFDTSSGADVVIGKSPQLPTAGDRIGVEQHGVGILVLHILLEHAGLDQSEIEVIDLTYDQHETAWTEHDIDHLITYEPVRSRLLDKGFVETLTSREFPNVIVDVLAVRRDRLYKQASLQHAVEAHFKALDYFRFNNDDARFRLAGRLSLPPDQVQQAFSGLILPDTAFNRLLLQGEHPGILKSLEIVKAAFKGHDFDIENVQVGEIIDANFLPAR